jgi:hypothetical protein
MAHAAPALRTPARRTPRTPDVFGARTHRIAAWAVPVAVGLVYGYWVAANDRFGGPVTGWNVLLGFVSAFVFAALCIAIVALAPRLRREVHAVLWAAFAGCAFGFLYSMTPDASVLGSTGLALVIAASVFVVVFYWYYTHEDAEGHRVR